MERLETHRWAGETLEILESAKRALLESRQGEVRGLVNHLPDPDGERERPITLAFAGQYSAGKSTLLRALTGLEDIPTGAGITTEETRTLDWNGVQVVDTPGIHTSLRPDHDTISYEAISQADLLVFVITNELFDSHLGDHFRKLAIDREKGHETILIVNKMDRTADGNTPETRETITDALREPLAPFTPEDLSITFTAAQDALEAENEEDDEIAGMLREDGNIEDMVLNLNKLISDKGAQCASHHNPLRSGPDDGGGDGHGTDGRHRHRHPHAGLQPEPPGDGRNPVRNCGSPRTTPS